MAQIDARNLACKVLLGEDREVLLCDLLPNHWLTQDGHMSTCPC
jgi:hypothetical protein